MLGFALSSTIFTLRIISRVRILRRRYRTERCLPPAKYLRWSVRHWSRRRFAEYGCSYLQVSYVDCYLRSPPIITTTAPSWLPQKSAVVLSPSNSSLSPSVSWFPSGSTTEPTTLVAWELDRVRLRGASQLRFSLFLPLFWVLGSCSCHSRRGP